MANVTPTMSQMDLNILQKYVAWQYGQLHPKNILYNDAGSVTAICNDPGQHRGRISLCRTDIAIKAAYYAKEKGRI
jgi:hypothetical protein